jgi:hypothetical protein
VILFAFPKRRYEKVAEFWSNFWPIQYSELYKDGNTRERAASSLESSL